jgi:hypothetical protein
VPRRSTRRTALLLSAVLAGGLAPAALPAPATAETATVTVATSIGRAQVRWQPMNGDVQGYRVFRAADGGTPALVATVPADGYARFDDTGVVPGRGYTYSVEAVHGSGTTDLGASATARVPLVEVVRGAERFGQPGATAVRDWSDGQHDPGFRVLGTTANDRTEVVSGRLGDVEGLLVRSLGNSGAGAPRRIADAAGVITAEASSDGTRLLLFREVWTGSATRYVATVLPVAGGEETRVPLVLDVEGASWIGTSALLTVRHPDGARALMRVDTTNGSGSVVEGTAGAFGQAHLSPDATRIAFTRLDGVEPDGTARTSVHTVGVGGGAPTQLGADLLTPLVNDWRADSRALLVDSATTTEEGVVASQLTEVPLDGSAGVRWAVRTTVPPGTTARYRHSTASTPAPSALPRGTTATSARITWAVDPYAAIYDVRTRKAKWDGGFALSTPLESRVSSGTRVASVPLLAGYEHCIDVRSRDAAGRPSTWVARCSSRALDDRGLTPSSGWTRASSQTGAYAGTLSIARRTGVTLTLGRVAMTRGWLVATTCSTCGAVTVSVGGRALGTVSLVSSTTRRQALLPLPGAGTARTGALVLRTSSTKQVPVDGVVVSHS